MIRAVIARSREPSACELIVTRDIVTLPKLQPARLIAPAPHKLRAPYKRMIDSPVERLPSDRRVAAVQRRPEPAQIEIVDDARCVVSLRVGETKIDVGVV